MGKEQSIPELVRRGQIGDQAAILALRELFNARPELWEEAGNLALQAERALVVVAVGDNEVLQEALYKKLGACRKKASVRE